MPPTIAIFITALHVALHYVLAFVGHYKLLTVSSFSKAMTWGLASYGTHSPGSVEGLLMSPLL